VDTIPSLVCNLGVSVLAGIGCGTLIYLFIRFILPSRRIVRIRRLELENGRHLETVGLMLRKTPADSGTYRAVSDGGAYHGERGNTG
jgi:hypothetical protein